jgi:hypothetical protein
MICLAIFLQVSFMCYRAVNSIDNAFGGPFYKFEEWQQRPHMEKEND